MILLYLNNKKATIIWGEQAVTSPKQNSMGLVFFGPDETKYTWDSVIHNVMIN